MKTVTVKLSVELNYLSGDSLPGEGYFEEGVSDPDFMNELAVWVDEEEKFDFEADEFKSTGRLQVFFAGSKRSFFELGRYFLAMSRFEAENPNYHDHLDGLADVEGRQSVELIVRLPK